MSDSIRHTWTIAKRELSGYFASPVAYVVIVIFLLLMGFFTFMLGGFFRAGEASLQFSFFRWHPWLYLFLVPAVGMRLWAEERRQGTLELLLTMPITAWQAIVGKFLASWLFLIIALALTFPVVMTISYLGDPDAGAVFSGYVGSALLAGAYLAVTCFTSALTRNQVISFILSVVICFFLILCGWEPVTDMFANLNVKSPWIWIPCSLVILALWFLAAFIHLQQYATSKRTLMSAVVSLLTAASAAGIYVRHVDGPVWLANLLMALGIALTIFTIVLIFRSLTSFSFALRIILAIVCGSFIASILALPWFCLLAWLVEPQILIKLVSAFSVMPHFAGFQKGVIDSRDLLYFLSVIGFALFCNGVVIRNLRAG